MSTTYTNGYIAAQKGRSLAFEVQEALLNSDDKEAHAHWVEEALHDLMATPRHDRAIPAFIRELLPLLTRGMAADEIEVTGVNLFRHPDGAGRFDFDADTGRIYLVNEEIGIASFALIGLLGLRDLGNALLALADELEG